METRVGTGFGPFCEKAPGTADHVFWRRSITNPDWIQPCDAMEANFGWPVRDNPVCTTWHTSGNSSWHRDTRGGVVSRRSSLALPVYGGSACAAV